MKKTLSEYGLHHVGYVVKDLDSVLGAMKDSLGEITYQMYDFKPTRAWCYGREVFNYQLKIAMVTLAENQTSVEIIQAVSPGMHRDAAEENSGINHICFAVAKDYDDWRAHFEGLGAEFVFESETEDTLVGYRRCFYIRDKTGNIIEIKETPYFRTQE